MKLNIEVERAGSCRQLQICHPVCRIGSDPNLELCIKGLDGHAATLRISNGKRILYSRSPMSIRVGRKIVHTDQSVEWLQGEEVSIGDQVRLRVVQAKTEVSSSDTERIAAIASTASGCKAKATSSIMTSQSSVAIAFLLVLGTLLFSSGSVSTDSALETKLNELVTELRELETGRDGEEAREVRFMLQSAVLIESMRPAFAQEILSRNLANPSHAELNERIASFVHSYLE